MRILIVNDDGIYAEGIKILVDWAKKLGEVTVCAPLNEQSAKSHSIEVRNSFTIEKVDIFNGIEAYAVDSTPADCVRFGIVGLKKSYDLVISGINKGFNLGNDILYSGTVSASFEAVAHNHKALALSTYYHSFDGAKLNLDKVYNFIMDNNLYDYNDLYSVNIPLEPKGIKITKKAQYFYYDDEFAIDDMGKYYQTTDFKYHYENDLSVDVCATLSDYISVSPLTTDRTNLQVFNKLLQLNK